MLSASIFLNKTKKQADKNTYETRKYQVTIIKGKISSSCDDHVSTINNSIDNLGTKIGQAIKGIGAAGTLTGKLENKKEKYSNVDGNLSNYSSNLSSEIVDCNTKIGELETQISSLQSQYVTALNDEKEAAKKLLEKCKI